MSRELPIIFDTESVRAILAGRKTQTRRAVKTGCVYSLSDGAKQRIFGLPVDVELVNELLAAPGRHPNQRIKAPCRPGDHLWVRETWSGWVAGDYPYLQYKASPDQSNADTMRYPASHGHINHDCFSDWKWRPSIHMPKWAARLWLTVTGVRIEQMQDISDADVIAEGAIQDRGRGETWYEGKHQEIFAGRWNTLNAKRGYSWESNPWVWVYDFEVDT